MINCSVRSVQRTLVIIDIFDEESDCLRKRLVLFAQCLVFTLQLLSRFLAHMSPSFVYCIALPVTIDPTPIDCLRDPFDTLHPHRTCSACHAPLSVPNDTGSTFDLATLFLVRAHPTTEHL